MGQDPYYYPGSTVLRNLLNLRDDASLEDAEQQLTTQRAETIEFRPPPYDFSYLKLLHYQLFQDVYDWAGKVRSIDISKGTTRFCTAGRIEPEACRLFDLLAATDWMAHSESRQRLIQELALLYGELNMLHPFRDGNGRAQRLLFEHIIINAGFEIDWRPISHQEWISVNIMAVNCDYSGLERVFERAIGNQIL